MAGTASNAAGAGRLQRRWGSPRCWGAQAVRCLLPLLFGLTGLGPLAAAEPDDPLYRSSGSWGQAFPDQWGLKALRVYVPAAGQAAIGVGRPVTVAVIDTGLDYEHPDLALSQLWRNGRETRNGRDDDGNGYVDDLIGWNFVDGNNNPWDLSGHGTHIAGTIAACTNNGAGIAAVNPQARIMALKVANFAGQARSSAVAAALYYAVDNGAQIINLSLGGELATELEREAAAYAEKQGVLLVVSAGNRGVQADPNGYPGLPGALVVGASGLDGERAGFSSFGAAVDVLAPGVDLLSLRARDTDFIGLSEPLDYEAGAATVGQDAAYYRASGTSFSAAMVSGLASRLLSQRPELNGRQIRNLLEQTAVDVAAPGVDQLSGFGRVDFVRALAGDPDLSLLARLSGVSLTLENEQILVNVQGQVQATDFAGATIAVRQRQKDLAPAEPEVDPASLSKRERRRYEQEQKRRAREAEKERRARQRRGEPEPIDPRAWQPLVAAIEKPSDRGLEGTLATVALDELIERTGGARAWELKLEVREASGASRSATMELALPAPEEAPQEASDDN